MLSIPSHQFEDLLAELSPEPSLDFHAIRLIIALLNHGLNQHHSPKCFCELPPSVNAEFSDYLSLALSSKLDIRLPDRLDDMLTGDVISLCRNAWNEFDRPIKIGFLNNVKLMLQHLIGYTR